MMRSSLRLLKFLMIPPHTRITKLWMETRRERHISGLLTQILTVIECGTECPTHRLNIVADGFNGKKQPARHRMVYAILREELERQGGIHALQLRTKTLEEDEPKDRV